MSPSSEQWLAASHDRRVSVWLADWGERHCQLMDWLTFPGPSSAPDGTQLKRGRQVKERKIKICFWPSGFADGYYSWMAMLFAAIYFNQYGFFVQCQWHLLPPSLARFSPNDPDSVLYSGYGLDMSLQFYSLTQKAVSTVVAVQVHSLHFCCQKCI